MSNRPGTGFQIPLVAGRWTPTAQTSGPLALALWCAGIAQRDTMGFEITLSDSNLLVWLGVSESTARRWWKTLERDGLIESVTTDGRGMRAKLGAAFGVERNAALSAAEQAFVGRFNHRPSLQGRTLLAVVNDEERSMAAFGVVLAGWRGNPHNYEGLVQAWRREVGKKILGDGATKPAEVRERGSGFGLRDDA